jgi:hypothetical protein
MGVCTASGRMGAMVAQVANAKLMIGSGSSNRDESTESIASVWVLIFASLALLFGAFMPLFLGRDASGGELKDDVGEICQRDDFSGIIGCGSTPNKEHLSDEEENNSNGLSTRSKTNAFQCVEYDSFRHEVEANQPFLL